jgi:hypothetical protein
MILLRLISDADDGATGIPIAAPAALALADDCDEKSKSPSSSPSPLRSIIMACFLLLDDEDDDGADKGRFLETDERVRVNTNDN